MSQRDSKPMVDENDADFVRFWNAYPKRVAKKETRIAWARMRPTSEQVDLMLIALAWQCNKPEWTKDEGQYIPFPATWLRAERWTDSEPRQAQPKAFSSAAEMVLRVIGG